MAEIGITFKNEGQMLHGMLHLPEFGSIHPCVIFLHDYTSNRIGDHCIFVKAARYLCEHGFACLRFDFRGSGESEGDFAEMTLDTEISDALAAIDFVNQTDLFDVSQIALVGQRLGGSV
ncbi:MAG TPA: alpha/beta hydrolase, partial [Firmicutes bacterium]|nr:alpha/beta hydrolase [Bacillota bacterium]